MEQLEAADLGPTSRTLSINIPGFRVPPTNGMWTLRAAAYFGVSGADFTPDGFERIFQVEVVGGEGIAGGTSDWAITGASASPVEPFLGTNVAFTAIIQVNTADPLPQTVMVACSLDGVELSKDPVTYDDGIAFLSVTSAPWVPTLGEHTIRLEVDPDHDYDDPHRANNVLELTFSVTETPPVPEGYDTGQTSTEAFDFYVTAVPTEQTVRSSVTYTVTVSATSGIPEPVQLTLIGSPAGVSYYFDPPSGSPSYTSTLTITTASGVAAGTYQMTIQASGGGRDRYKPITLVVEQGPDYSISITPDSVQTRPGGTEEFTIQVSSESGYSQSVNLMVSGLPNGVTWNLEPSASTPTFQSTLTLQVGNDVKPGVYSITVTGSGPDPKRHVITLRVEGVVEQPGRQREAMVDYLAVAILGVIIAAVAGVSFMAFRRFRRFRGKKARGYFCIECRAELTPGLDFCPKCGTRQPNWGGSVEE
jgi:hypothetical protein